MDPAQQQQTSADTTAQMPAQADPNVAPPFDPNFMQQLDPSAMASILSGQPFVADPSMAGLPMGDPSAMMPIMFPNGQVQVPPQAPPRAVSADEIALYDRQIRLWGMAAQAKIQNANVLLITMRALANEIAKNLVLAGISSLTILDSAVVTEPDFGAQFLLDQDGLGKNRAEAAAPALRKLNPRVQVHVDPEGVKTKGPSYFSAYDVVIATDLDPDSFNLINTATRINGKAFYAAGTHGMYGFIFSDLIEHDYVIERDAGNVPTHAPQQETRTRSIVGVQTKEEGGKTVESVTKRELYSTWFLASDIATLPAEYTSSKRRLRAVNPALSCLRALWEFMQLQGRLPATRDDLKLFTQLATQKHKALSLPSETLRPEVLRSFLQNLGSEIAPVTAILGGQLAQDVINVLGHRQQPIQNTVVFDGSSMEALVYALHPEGNLGASLLDNTAGGSINGANGALPGNGVPPMMGLPMDMNGMGMGMLPPGAGFPIDPAGAGFAQNSMTMAMGMGMPDAALLQQQQQQPPQQPPQQQPQPAQSEQPQLPQRPQQPQQPQQQAAPSAPEQAAQPEQAPAAAPPTTTAPES